VTVDAKGIAAMYALIKVVRQQLMPKAQRTVLLAAVAALLETKLAKFNRNQGVTYFIWHWYAVVRTLGFRRIC